MSATPQEIGADWIELRLGLWVQEQRKRMGWNQSELAALVGVHRNTVSRWELASYEQEQAGPPRITDFVAMCDLFGKDPARALLAIIREPRESAPAPKKPSQPVPTLGKVMGEGLPGTVKELVREREQWPMQREKRAALR